jgi:hypothetical protein
MGQSGQVHGNIHATEKFVRRGFHNEQIAILLMTQLPEITECLGCFPKCCSMLDNKQIVQECQGVVVQVVLIPNTSLLGQSPTTNRLKRGWASYKFSIPFKISAIANPHDENVGL